MHTTVVSHHSENKPFQILNYPSGADCTGTSNFLTNRHLNNDVFSLQALQPFKGESFHSLERDLHSNSSLKGLESPSNNSMIIGPCHSQWFFSKWTGEGGMRRKQEDSAVYFRQFIVQPPLEFKILRPSITERVIWSCGDLQSRWIDILL